MRAIGYQPHFTFAIYDRDDVDMELRRTVIQHAADGKTEARLTFNRLRILAGLPVVL